MDKATAINNAKKYAIQVQKRMNPSSIILFGSYVNGTPNEYSDIDIAIIFDGFKGNKWDASSELWEMTVDIDDRIEPILLDKSKDMSGFVKELLTTGYELINDN